MFSRCLSSLKDDRVEASKQLEGPPATKFTGDKKQFIEDVRICFTRPRPVLCAGQFVNSSFRDHIFEMV